MEQKRKEENIEKKKSCFFVSIVENYLQSNQYKNLFFEIRHIKTKYISFLISVYL